MEVESQREEEEEIAIASIGDDDPYVVLAFSDKWSTFCSLRISNSFIAQTIFTMRNSTLTQCKVFVCSP